MARYYSRLVGPVLRWYGALLPLMAAIAATVLAVLIAAHGGNQWCAENSFSCSLHTNLLIVFAIGAATTYWYFGLRRGLLLARYRRRLRKYVKAENRYSDSRAAAYDDVTARVLAVHRNWRTRPRMTLVAGTDKETAFVEIVSRLCAAGSWVVPVPVGRVKTGGPADLLRAAKQEFELILLDVNASQELIDWLWQSLLRCGRVLFVVDDIESIAPAMSSSERELIIRRLFTSARHLRLPFFGTGKLDLLDSSYGSVFELPHVPVDVIRRQLATAGTLDDTSLTIVGEAASGVLATPYMVERLARLLGRTGEVTVTALRIASTDVHDLVLWRALLAEYVVPGAVITPAALQLVSFCLTTSGQLEITISNNEEWRRIVTFSSGFGIDLPFYGTDAEIRSYVDGGFLDTESNRSLVRFSSPDAQAALAAEFLVAEPNQLRAMLPQLPINTTARRAIANALRLDRDTGGVFAALQRAIAVDVPPAVEAAGLCLALRHPPKTLPSGTEMQLAERLALTLADRISSPSGPILNHAGLQEAVETLDQSVRQDVDRQLLLALRNSHFPVRLSMALALLRRGRSAEWLDSVAKWINQAESSTALGVQYELELAIALWFCPYLREHDSDGRGSELYARGVQLALAEDSNPLLFETSLCRGFKFAAWTYPCREPDLAAAELLGSGTARFWYSRISLVHALGVRLASTHNSVGRVDPASESVTCAERAIHRATSDPHPLVREAALLTLAGVAAGRCPEMYIWIAETDMARSNSQLDGAVQCLLGDTSLFLNLIYCAEPWSDPLRQRLSASADLPACIRRPVDRERHMRDGCPSDCLFGLCPYPGPARRGRAHGELSGSFCRTQADLAMKLRCAPWQEKHPRRELAAFWLYAEEHLASRDGWEINL